MSDEAAQIKSSTVLRKIDEQIANYHRNQAKKSWLEIDAHWKSQAEFKKITLEKAKKYFNQEELFVLGIM